MGGLSGSVAGVDPDVLLREIAGPEACPPAAAAEDCKTDVAIALTELGL